MFCFNTLSAVCLSLQGIQGTAHGWDDVAVRPHGEPSVFPERIFGRFLLCKAASSGGYTAFWNIHSFSLRMHGFFRWVLWLVCLTPTFVYPVQGMLASNTAIRAASGKDVLHLNSARQV